jgi:hypothetical protein
LKLRVLVTEAAYQAGLLRQTYWAPYFLASQLIFGKRKTRRSFRQKMVAQLA